MNDIPEPSLDGSILQKIVQAKRKEIESQQCFVSLSEMRERAFDMPPVRDFLHAVTRPGRMRLIAEIKKASPSKGIIRADFDPEAIAAAYEEGGADALSVLTDEPFFQGSIEIFQKVRAAVQLPMLRKDFMIDPYQFYEARVIGADAVLLITSILSTAMLQEFHGLAQTLGMAVLVETHSSSDIERALGCMEPALLGINNRDLHHPEMKTDITHTERMLPVVKEILSRRPMNHKVHLVSESGIYKPEDVAYLKFLGISAVLVGESLMRQADPGQAASNLMRSA